MKYRNVFRRQNIIVVCCVLGTMMVVGTLFDYKISQLLFHPSSTIGILFASYGQVPVALCMSIAGMLLIYITQRKNKVFLFLSYVCGFALTVFAIAMMTLDPLLYMNDMPFFLSLAIAVTLVVVIDVLMFKLVQDTKKEDLKKFMILLLITMFLAIFLINILKIFWGRPRMRMIAITPEATFQPWWVIGSNAKEYLMGLGVAAEEFKSFPSGHSANAACIMLLGALPLICPKAKGKEDLLFYIGFGITLAIAFSRVIMGAHFITDITVGISITFLVETIGIRSLWKVRNTDINDHDAIH